MPKQEIVKKQDRTPEGFIGQAIDKGLSVEAIEKLIMMRRELKQEYAKEQYTKAMAAFQAKCPVIEKAKDGGKTKTGQVAYRYSPLDQIRKETKDLIKKYGFSFSFKTGRVENRVMARCIVSHEDGHTDFALVDLPLTTGTGVMSTTQVEAATMSFAKRYAYCDAFGIVTGGEDDEKNLQEAEKTQADQKSKKLEIATKLINQRKTIEDLRNDIKRIKESSYDDMEKDYLILEAERRIQEINDES